MRVAIVGAGIGGLTAGLCLAQAGIGEVTLHERAPALSEIGAGIQISPNGSRILHGLGLRPALDAVAVRPRTGDMRRWEDWSLLSSSPLGDDVVTEYGFPYTTSSAPTCSVCWRTPPTRVGSSWAAG